jgi:Ca2+-binding EF-hand superfamily protein
MEIVAGVTLAEAPPMRRIGGLVFALCLLALPAAAQQMDAAAQTFLNALQPGSTLNAYMERLRQEFRQLDADQDGVLTAADADLHEAVAKAQARATAAMQLLRFDLNRDGAVTADEVRRSLAYERRGHGGGAVQGIEEFVARTMAADKDGDGKVTIAEAMNAVDNPTAENRFTWMYSLSARVRQLLALSPNGNGRVTLADFEAAGAAQFRAADSDNNGTISQEELNAYRQRMVEDMRHNAEAARDAQAQAECVMPKATPGTKVVLLSANRAEALSRVALGSQDVVTGVGEIAVAPGGEPLYLVVVTEEPTIWRITGAVDRVERFVGAALSTLEAKSRANVIGQSIIIRTQEQSPAQVQAAPLMGVSGLPADRVTFLARRTCLKAFVEAKSTDAAYSVALVRRHTGQEPAVIAGRYNVGGFVVPAGTIRSGHDDKTQPRLTIVKESGTLTLRGDTSGVVIQTGPVDLDQDLARLRPGGVVDIDEKSLVANAPAARYDILPSLAGLMQLQNAGAITRNGRGEFIIRRQIRFPAGLSDHPVKFLLLRGVPPPQGDAGGATVISEETGAAIRFDRR